jgi:hypothetical protein
MQARAMQAEMPRSHTEEKPCADHHQIGTAQIYSANFQIYSKDQHITPSRLYGLFGALEMSCLGACKALD